jgi:hypothetical protein
MARAKKEIERRVGDRFATHMEFDGRYCLFVYELQERKGQRWNVLIEELVFDTLAQAREVAKWIR